MDQETKKEFEELTQIIQESFNGVATKADLKQFATKADLKQFATKADLGGLEIRLLDGMDDKLSNLKGDLVVMMRKEDKKVVSLIELLQGKAVLTEKEAKKLLSSEPFPQLRLYPQKG